jgi:O-antigen/teichoic acid export membrane protein
MALLISYPLGSILVIYVPILSGLYAKKMLKEIRVNFSIVTKWLCSLTLPLFIFLFIFSEQTIVYLFGPNYVDASNALRILSISLIINNYVGPCGATLVAMGKPRFIMYATLSTAIINIILNAMLIPEYGIEGAAIASAISVISINIIKSIKLYRMSGVTPISKNLMKPTFITLLILIPTYLLYHETIVFDSLMIIILFIMIYLVYFLVLLVSKSVDKEDIEFLEDIERSPKSAISKIKRFLSRFT